MSAERPHPESLLSLVEKVRSVRGKALSVVAACTLMAPSGAAAVETVSAGRGISAEQFGPLHDPYEGRSAEAGGLDVRGLRGWHVLSEARTLRELRETSHGVPLAAVGNEEAEEILNPMAVPEAVRVPLEQKVGLEFEIFDYFQRLYPNDEEVMSDFRSWRAYLRTPEPYDTYGLSTPESVRGMSRHEIAYLDGLFAAREAAERAAEQAADAIYGPVG